MIDNGNDDHGDNDGDSGSNDGDDDSIFLFKYIESKKNCFIIFFK